jgi:hypothetical protein
MSEGDMTTKNTKITKERPILYGGEMIRAILDGRKTQTRRIIALRDFRPCNNILGSDWYFRAKNGIWSDVSTERLIAKYCPYGKPGDRLWVRETFVLEKYIWQSVGDEEILHLPTDRPYDHHPAISNDDEYWLIPHYRATDPTPDLAYEGVDQPTCRWRPSIFMPRWASRIKQLITNIRVERVQDITEEDAVKEGFVYEYPVTARTAFLTYFDQHSNNQKSNRNPRVWVIETKLEEPDYG